MRDGARRRIVEYNNHIALITARYRVSLADLYAASRDEILARPDFFAADGVHPSAAGYEIWARLMWATIGEAIGIK